MDRRTLELYEFGSFQLDPLNRRLMSGSQHVPMTPMAFKTLLLLVENRGTLVTKAELLAQIWPDTAVDETNLAVVISAVRKALGDDGHAQRYVETVAKAGYRFAAEVTTDAKRASRRRPWSPCGPGANRIPSALSARPHRSIFLLVGSAAALASRFGLHRLQGGILLSPRLRFT